MSGVYGYYDVSESRLLDQVNCAQKVVAHVAMATTRLHDLAQHMAGGQTDSLFAELVNSAPATYVQTRELCKSGIFANASRMYKPDVNLDRLQLAVVDDEENQTTGEIHTINNAKKEEEEENTHRYGSLDGSDDDEDESDYGGGNDYDDDDDEFDF